MINFFFRLLVIYFYTFETKGLNVGVFSITDFKEQCMDHEFQCKNNMCISVDYVCDDKDDCYDGSDETNCGKL